MNRWWNKTEEDCIQIFHCKCKLFTNFYDCHRKYRLLYWLTDYCSVYLIWLHVGTVVGQIDSMYSTVQARIAHGTILYNDPLFVSILGVISLSNYVTHHTYEWHRRKSYCVSIGHKQYVFKNELYSHVNKNCILFDCMVGTVVRHTDSMQRVTVQARTANVPTYLLKNELYGHINKNRPILYIKIFYDLVCTQLYRDFKPKQMTSGISSYYTEQ